jgi:hypothetical protein
VADLTIASADVVSGAAAAFTQGIAGEVIDAGEWCYLDATTHTYKLATANGVQALAEGVGMAVNSAAALGQALRLQKGGQVAVGGTVVVGQLYLVSTTAGKLRPVSDLASGQWVSLAAVGLSGNVLDLHPVNMGVLRA